MREDNGTWYCKFWIGEEKRYQKRCFGEGESEKLKAQEFDLMIKKMKRSGKKLVIPVEPEPQQKKELHYDELANLYFEDKKLTRAKKSTDNFLYFTNRYVIPYMGHKLCRDITESDLTKLRAYIFQNPSKKKDISENSVNRYTYRTRTVFNWGVENKYIDFNPWPKYTKPKEKPAPRDLLDTKELKWLMACSPPHLSWALDVGFNTGCRPGQSELFSLRYENVMWEWEKLTIHSTKTGKRVIPLKDVFLERLREKEKTSQSGFIIEYKGKPVKGLKRSLKTALKRSGITKKVRLYDIRHLYGTTLAENGIDAFTIMALMGHTEITTTVRYIHKGEQAQINGVNTLPDLVPKIVPKKKEGDNVIPLTP
jgi:integrase